VGVGLLENLRLRSAGNSVFALALPADPDTARLDLRGHSLFGPRLVSSFPFDSLRLMKGKCHEYYIDRPRDSPQRRFFRRLLD